MLRKIIEKLKFGSCKIETLDNVDTIKKSEKKQITDVEK